jgi:hypothetical protein
MADIPECAPCLQSGRRIARHKQTLCPRGRYGVKYAPDPVSSARLPYFHRQGQFGVQGATVNFRRDPGSTPIRADRAGASGNRSAGRAGWSTAQHWPQGWSALHPDPTRARRRRTRSTLQQRAVGMAVELARPPPANDITLWHLPVSAVPRMASACILQALVPLGVADHAWCALSSEKTPMAPLFISATQQC